MEEDSRRHLLAGGCSTNEPKRIPIITLAIKKEEEITLSSPPPSLTFPTRISIDRGGGVARERRTV